MAVFICFGFFFVLLLLFAQAATIAISLHLITNTEMVAFSIMALLICCALAGVDAQQRRGLKVSILKVVFSRPGQAEF